MLSAIVAVTKNGVIGNSGDLPWYLPADLRRFKEVTTGHAVIMGRTTYDSIANRLGHALPNRQNIVLTRNPAQSAEDIATVSSMEDALALINDGEAFVIGGSQIYELAGPHINRWYVTEIDADIQGDVLLRGFNKADFKEVKREKHQADEKNQYNYDFVIYERI